MKYRILGSSNDVTTCECCGKANLKKTIVLDDYLGNVMYLGVNCAAKYMQLKTNEFKSLYNSELKEIQRQKKIFINDHQITKQMNEEISKVNKENLSFKERVEKGYTKRWREMEATVRKEAEEKYMFA